MAYVQFHMKESPAENVTSVVTRFYSPEGIQSAKILLWKCHAQDVLEDCPTWVKSTKRQAYEADALDIISAFQKWIHMIWIFQYLLHLILIISPSTVLNRLLVLSETWLLVLNKD